MEAKAEELPARALLKGIAILAFVPLVFLILKMRCKDVD